MSGEAATDSGPQPSAIEGKTTTILRRPRSWLPWSGWLIIGVAFIVYIRAPESAKRCFWWSVEETWDPSTPYGPTMVFDWPPQNFKKPERYFPAGIFGYDRDGGERSAEWYSESLIQLQEPPLFDSRDRETVRLTYIRSFHDPVCVRLYLDAAKAWRLLSKRASGYGSETFIEFQRDAAVSSAIVENLQQQLERAGFWSMPSYEKDDGALDGAQWILEANFNGNYHVVDRWSPGPGQYRDACVWLLQKGRVDHGPLY